MIMQNFSQTSRTIALVSSIVGGIVLFGVGGTAALGAVRAAATPPSVASTQSASMDGVTGIEVSSSAAQFTVEFANVSEATLSVDGADRSRWTLTVDEQDLVVRNARDFFGFCLGWCSSPTDQVTLTLPKSFDAGTLDADFEVHSGSLTAHGAYREVSLEVNAGALFFTGGATSLDATVNAGRAEIEAARVKTADLEVSAGRMVTVVTGSQPREVSLDVSAGRLDLTVPRGTYNVRSDVSAGTLDNQLDTASSASSLIDADVSAGSAVLRSGK